MPPRQPRFSSRFIPSVPPGDAIRRRVGRGEYHFSLSGERTGEKGGKGRYAARAAKRSRNGKQKSHDDFHLISRYYPIGGGDYGCPALSPRGGGFASSFSFSFSSFLVLALDCYLLPLCTENGDRFFPYRSAAVAIAMTVYFAVAISRICRSGPRPRRYRPQRTSRGRPA